MRRIVFLVALTAICLSFVSCSAVMGYGEPEERLIASALGIDGDGEKITVSLRVSGVGSGVLLKGEGGSVESAMAHLRGGDSKMPELSHLAVIVMGDGIDEEAMSEIFEYCRANREITVGVSLTAAYNAEELLSVETADGYSLSAALREGRGGVGFASGSRFFEIENGQKPGHLRLPYFSAADGEFSLSGLKLYCENDVTVRLDREESALYMLACGLFKGGFVDVNDKTSVRILSASSRLRPEEDGGTNYIECRIKTNGKLSGDEVEELSARMSRLCGELVQRYGTLSGLSEIMGKETSGDEEVRIKCIVIESV